MKVAVKACRDLGAWGTQKSTLRNPQGFVEPSLRTPCVGITLDVTFVTSAIDINECSSTEKTVQSSYL